jgi:hypothetical protein
LTLCNGRCYIVSRVPRADLPMRRECDAKA